MELHEYILKKEQAINQLINSSLFKNQFGQIFAQKMGAEFNATYDETTIWGQALFLSSTSVRVLKNKTSQVCVQALKVAAELFETMSIMSKEYDKDYAKVLSALCYDLSGYQANSVCMLRSLNYEIEQIGLLDGSLNQLFTFVTLLMKRQLQAVEKMISQDVGISDKEEIEFHWKAAIDGFIQYQLTGEKNDFEYEISEAKDQAIHLRDATLTTILSLLDLKFALSYQRTTWTILSDELKYNPDTWIPYLRLLASNPYSDEKLLPQEIRVSNSELWQSQIEAIDKGLLKDNKGFIIQMPTSAGKTLIAEMAILQQISLNKKCLYIAPFRSLVTEVENTLSSHLSRLGYSVSSLTGGFEFDDLDQFWITESDVLIATPEKVDFLLRVKPEMFNDFSLIVVDEGHVLGNLDSRSAQFELLLTRLKRWFIPKGCRFLFISAVMPDKDSNDFAKWLISDERAKIQSPLLFDGSNWQPTRRLLGYFSWVGENGRVDFKNYVQNTERSFDKFFIPNIIGKINWNTIQGKKVKKIKQNSYPNNKSETTALLALKYLDEGSVLIFCATVGRKSGGAGVFSVLKAFFKLIKILDENFDDTHQFPRIDESEALEAAIRWYGEDHIITECIKRGVAPHFGDLADEVRKAVEREYVQKKIRVLIATSTLGQGVNLPVKTLLVYSLDINPNPQERISVKIRDFWNIVGRAGRAGRETEGQIIFIINSARDRQLFDLYSDPNNSERVRSIFTVAMELFRNGRLSYETLDEIISDVTEPSLMNFLVEEVVNTPDQRLMESFIGDTLFKIQSIEGDSEYVNDILLKNATRFWDIESRERKVLFSRTGLSIDSCLEIEKTLTESLLDLQEAFINNNQEVFLRLALKCILKLEEMHPKDTFKNVNISGNPELEPFLLSWIQGASIDDLRPLWINAVGDDFSDLINVYIEDCLSFKYPWGITAVIFIASLVLNRDWKDFDSTITSFPSKIKYGLNNKYSLWLRSIGITSRESCLTLSSVYKGPSEILAFAKWLLNLNIDELTSFGIVSKYSLRNIFSVTTKLTLKTDVKKAQVLQTFVVKGIPYESERVETAKLVKVGDLLTLKRQPDNEFDQFAIQVWSGDNQLGFVPRELAKSLSFQMDIMTVNIECKVESKVGTRILATARI
ncbi:DEAD/DEAH box helicase [Paenibacillus sp. FSL E2-0230]|uniref:DEAD/DEAH box helicase n=1 Tax=unclassified Paenibacillus TaxID=185978 RepID=UPI0030D24B68